MSEDEPQQKAPSSGIYKPLPEGYIRVLHLQPIKKLRAPLIATLEPVQLGEDAEYEALSYSWDGVYGDDPPMEPGQLYLDGSPIAITGNLQDALRRLRLKAKARALWVDAVCINQDDTSERSAQVAIMAQIYSGATQVVMWLGEDSTERDGKVYFKRVEWYVRITRLLGKYRDPGLLAYDRYMGDWLKFSPWYKTPRKVLYFIYQFWMHPKLSWHPYERRTYYRRRFKKRRYFHRKWCVQEAALARKAILVCGTHSASLMTCYDFANDLNHIGQPAIYDIVVSNPTTNPVTLLAECTPLRCLDERDAIYSLTSMLEALPGCPTINIDYTLHWTTVYTRFTCDLINKDGLSSGWRILLWAASQPERYAGLPSWVPQWQNPRLDGDLQWVMSNPTSQVLLDTNSSAMVCNETSLKMRLAYHGTVQQFRLMTDTTSSTVSFPELDKHQPDECLYGLNYPQFGNEMEPFEHWHLLVLQPCENDAELHYRSTGFISILTKPDGNPRWESTFVAMHDVTIF